MLPHELKLAAAALLRVPGFALTVIFTLAITLGALICIFSLNNLLLLKPLPYPDAERLMVIEQSYTQDGQTESGGQSMPGMLLWYKQQTAQMSEMAQMALILDTNQNITSHPEQPSAALNFVTPEYFPLLQVPMHFGRAMNAAEGPNSQQPVAVLSYASWLKWYGGNVDVIGTKTRIGDVGYTIIGVTAKTFNAPQIAGNEAIEIWLPWDFQTMDSGNWGRQTGSLMGLGRLQDGVSAAQATAAMSQQINKVFITTEDARAGDSAGAVLIPLKQAILGDSRKIAWLLLSGVVGLLLIATTNVTNLFLSRAAQKQRTMAIQAALGAKPGQLFVSMFAESLLLCSIAGLLGLLVAGWGFVLLQEMAARQLPRMAELGLDGTTLGFAALMVLLLAAVFAKLSSRVIDYEQLQSQLQSSGKGGGLQISRRSRHLLIATQVMLATVLLTGATAVIQQAVATVLRPLGFNQKQMLYLRIDKPKGYQGSTELDRMTTQIRTEINRLPQVQQASRSIVPPIFRGRLRRDLLAMDGQRLGSFSFNQVDANYFELLQLPLLQGRTFSVQNNPQETVNEIIMSESMARHLRPDGNVIGQFFNEGEEQAFKVVGIVKDYFNPGQRSEEDSRRYYRPYASTRFFGFDIKLAEGGVLSKQTLLQLLHGIDPKLRIGYLNSHSQRHQDLLYRHKLAAALTLGLAMLALVLAAAGIYGVLNYSTQMRRYELGIHLALGAKTHQVRNMVLKESFRPVLYGLLASAVVVLLAYLLVRQQFTALIPLNTPAVIVTLGIMLMVAALACYLPVKKVIMADPVKALRNE